MKHRSIFWITFLVFYSSLFAAHAYRIEISNPAIANTPVFLAGYYGDQVSVVDSLVADASGKAVFERCRELCVGMYTLVAPGKLKYDLLLHEEQRLRIEWLPTGEVRVEGDEPTAAWAEYQAWAESRTDRAQLVERRRQLIGEFPGTFLAAYLTALQPVEPPDAETVSDIGQLLQAYQYRRRHFFDNMPLSDVRLLRTPLYHGTIHYYMNQFVTQHADSMIHIAYRMLEQASGNYETFFYVSDFLIDFSLRNHAKIKDINRMHNFVNRNRDMLGEKGQTMLPARTNINFFKIPGEQELKSRIENMPLTDINGQRFELKAAAGNFRALYFWQNNCPRCIADAARLQSVLNRHANKSCFGIAVNMKEDVQMAENRILAFEPLCINVSAKDMQWCETIFFTLLYSKIVVIDADGNLVGIFPSAASFDNFMRIAQ